MKRKASTLIELLVVIAIIAILAAILFPVFTKAKDAAKKTTSISNLKQIGLSTLMYAGDFDDVYPMSAYIKAPEAPDPRPVVFSIYDAVQPYMKNVQLFVSPADGQKQDWKLRLNGLNLTNPQGGVQFASYSPNLGLFGENLCALPAPVGKYSDVWSQTSLPDTVNTVAFFDGYILKDLANPAKGIGLTYNKFMAIARHAEGMVLNFADGHAKFYKWNGISGIGRDHPLLGTARPGVPYYSWRTDIPFAQNEGALELVTNTPSQPYNDLHGIPGTQVGDSEDYPCN
jgi:prepilin-type N-terminal cleavage/methylation domain-containing protein